METPRSSFRLTPKTLGRIAAIQAALREDDYWHAEVSKTQVIERAVDELYRKHCIPKTAPGPGPRQATKGPDPMTPNRIREALKTQPFRPFDIVIADGQTFTISHPDWVAVPPFDFAREITVFTRIEGEHEQCHAHLINLDQVRQARHPNRDGRRQDRATIRRQRRLEPTARERSGVHLLSYHASAAVGGPRQQRYTQGNCSPALKEPKA